MTNICSSYSLTMSSNDLLLILYPPRVRPRDIGQLYQIWKVCGMYRSLSTGICSDQLCVIFSRTPHGTELLPLDLQLCILYRLMSQPRNLSAQPVPRLKMGRTRGLTGDTGEP